MTANGRVRFILTDRIPWVIDRCEILKKKKKKNYVEGHLLFVSLTETSHLV